jgi:hypothetical protein
MAARLCREKDRQKCDPRGVWLAMARKPGTNTVAKRAASEAPAAPPAWELHVGDCLTGMASLPDKSVDVVITDPP